MESKPVLFTFLWSHKTRTFYIFDGYQGNEADVVLFSTVRSVKLGFTEDAKRMNVVFKKKDIKRQVSVIVNVTCNNKDKSKMILILTDRK